MSIDVSHLDRNDAEAALAEYRAAKKRGELDGDDVHVLLMLQDDPTELLALIKAEK